MQCYSHVQMFCVVKITFCPNTLCTYKIYSSFFNSPSYLEIPKKDGSNLELKLYFIIIWPLN